MTDWMDEQMIRDGGVPGMRPEQPMPCPHCGSAAHVYYRPPMPMGGCDDWGVRCEKTVQCGAELSAYGNFKPESAIAKWNRRPGSSMETQS